MVAPVAFEVKLTITAPFCAATVVMFGVADGGGAPPQPTWHWVTTAPPPHPHKEAPDKKTAATISAPVRIASLPSRKDWARSPSRREYQSISGMPASNAVGPHRRNRQANQADRAFAGRAYLSGCLPLRWRTEHISKKRTAGRAAAVKQLHPGRSRRSHMLSFA
jgi:hypothetical protein